MKYFFMMLSTMAIISALLALIFFYMQSKNKENQEEKSAFECGFLSTDKAQKSFSISYFYMTIIFLIFDLEILILAPLMIFSASPLSWGILLIITIYFTAILSMEWNNNMLEWNS